MSDAPIDDLITSKGGAAKVAREIGISAGAVRQWKFKGRIPRTAWPELTRVFPDVTTDRLLEIERAA